MALPPEPALAYQSARERFVPQLPRSPLRVKNPAGLGNDTSSFRHVDRMDPLVLPCTPMPKREPSRIPVGTQFSPDLIDLPAFLRALIAHGGERAALVDAVWTPGVRIRSVARTPTARRAKLPLEAASQYGLLTRTAWEPTDLTRRLAALTPPVLYEEFAQHVLLNCGGLRVVEGAEQMALDRLKVNADTLAAYLTDQGFRVTVHNTAINSLRMWLAQVGIFPARGWTVDREAKERILGLSDEALAVLVGLDEGQRAFVKALCEIAPAGWYPAADVRAHAEATTGLRLARTSLPSQFLAPLADAGLIEYRSGGTSGGKSAQLKLRGPFTTEVLEPFIERTVKDLDAAVTAYYRWRPEDIYSGMDSNDKFKKGQALEAYAIHIMRLLGLRFVGWRMRPREHTGRAEVDVVLAGVFGSVPARLQVQCKNTPAGKVDVEDVAKEVGLAALTRATHVVVIANCSFTSDAQTFAEEVTRRTPLAVLLIDKKDFSEIKKNPGRLGPILRAKAELAVKLAAAEGFWGAKP